MAGQGQRIRSDGLAWPTGNAAGRGTAGTQGLKAVLASARRRRGVTRVTRQAAAACSGLEVQVESEHDRFPLARSLRRARVAAGTARGTNPTEPSRRPAAWPERPCAPLLACARTPPARSTPGWAHRFGSPVLPIKTPGLGHRPDSDGSRNWQILVRLGRSKKLYADLGTLGEYRQEVKSMNKMS